MGPNTTGLGRGLKTSIGSSSFLLFMSGVGSLVETESPIFPHTTHECKTVTRTTSTTSGPRRRVGGVPVGAHLTSGHLVSLVGSLWQSSLYQTRKRVSELHSRMSTSDILMFLTTKSPKIKVLPHGNVSE